MYPPNVTWLFHEACSANKPPNTVIPSYHMLHFVFRGSGYFNGRHITAGQMFLVRSHCLSEWYPDPADPWEYGFVNGSGDAFEAILSELGFDGECVLPLHHPHEVELLVHLADAAESDTAFIASLFYSISRLQLHTQESLGRKDPRQQMRHAVQYIEARSGNTTPTAVAQAMNLSRGYLRNLFSDAFGQSLQAYIIECRLHTAEKLLLQTDRSISEIAASVGYDDPLHFSKAFKKKHGISPRDYRNARPQA